MLELVSRSRKKKSRVASIKNQEQEECKTKRFLLWCCCGSGPIKRLPGREEKNHQHDRKHENRENGKRLGKLRLRSIPKDRISPALRDCSDHSKHQRGHEPEKRVYEIQQDRTGDEADHESLPRGAVEHTAGQSTGWRHSQQWVLPRIFAFRYKKMLQVIYNPAGIRRDFIGTCAFPLVPASEFKRRLIEVTLIQAA
jgi:hypothetical protein